MRCPPKIMSFFSAASCKKDIIFGGHLKQISALLIKLGLYWYCKLKSFINCQIFLPIGHPKSQPFFDRVYTFSLIDDKIWFRHYQVLPEEDGSLAEIGPRFVLNPIKIFDASFSGATLWESPNFTTPAKKRALLKRMKAGKYIRYAFFEYIPYTRHHNPLLIWNRPWL